MVQPLLVINVTSNYVSLEQTIYRIILIEFVIRTVIAQHLISFIEVTKTRVLGRENDADGVENYLRDAQEGDCELHGTAGASVDPWTHRRE